MKNKILLLLLIVALQSCASKKDVLYFQDAQSYVNNAITYGESTVQPNDILKITVSALVLESAMPYNIQVPSENINTSVDLLKLQGYLVSKEGTISFPILGRLQVANKTPGDIEKELEGILEDGGHLVKPMVSVRLLNAKVTILGEVNAPGTYSFTEQNITLPQALGYAGDLTINGERNNIMLIREEQGERRITHLDLTHTDWFNSPQYYIKPNDVIVVNPNVSKVKSAGFIGNAGTILTIASLILTSVVLLTR